MNYDNSWIYACGVCCIWPLIVWAVLTWLINGARRVDWSNIQWPWRKNNV